jgi:hypothetical protein
MSSQSSGGTFAFVLFVIFAVTVLLIAVLSGGDSDNPDDGSSGPGDGGPELPRPPDDGPSAGEPDWWPDFERQFGSYVERGAFTRRRARQDRSEA